MEKAANFAEIGVKEPKKPSFSTKLKNKYGIVQVVAWYTRKRYPTVEINLVEIKQEVKVTVFAWVSDFIWWFFKLSVSGLILWIPMRMLFLTGPPVFLFPVFGLVYWIFMKFIGDVRDQVRGR